VQNTRRDVGIALGARSYLEFRHEATVAACVRANERAPASRTEVALSQRDRPFSATSRTKCGLPLGAVARRFMRKLGTGTFPLTAGSPN
jgi:hypothetical protein